MDGIPQQNSPDYEAINLLRISDKSSGSGIVKGHVRWILRAEGLAAIIIATALYANFDFNWWLYFLIFFAPDISFAGYLLGPRPGALTYNLLHSYASAAILAIIAYMFRNQMVFSIALIWVSHIGFDRMLGFGLKYTTGFGDTHLGIMGKQKA